MTEYTAAEKGEIKADLTELYTAGKQTIPSRAEAVADIAADMSSAIESANMQAANMGDHPVLKQVLGLAVDCQHGVNRAVTTLNNLAAGVIAVADDYAERDDYARSVFNGLQKKLGLTPELGDSETTPVEEPGADDKDFVLGDGAPSGPRVQENPDVETPETDLDNRNDEAGDNIDDIDIPEES